MTAGELAAMEDFQFRDAWLNLTIEQRREFSREDTAHFLDRYNTLTKWKPRRTNGDARVNGFDQTPDYDPGPVPEEEPARPQSNIIDWSQLTGDPPERAWIMDQWLSWNPTLIAGRGSIGKSLLMQHVATSLACNKSLWTGASACGPLNVLYWGCEDDRDELWRRETKICKHLKVSFDDIKALHIDARNGLDNTLMATSFGSLKFTSVIETLRQQLNDWNIDVFMLDNIAHAFGGNENVRYEATTFVNHINGMVKGRDFCPIFMGHPSRAPGSEFSGSGAWENSVRMRWYMDDRMPDIKSEDGDPIDPDYRVLSKRKQNYTIKDFMEFRYADGVFVPQFRETGDPGLMASLRKKRARAVLLTAMRRLADVKIYGSDRSGRTYLPHLIVQNSLSEGFTKAELGDAMRTMIMGKEIEMADFGKNASRHPVSGLRAIVTE